MTIVITFIKVLHNILFAAGFLAIGVLASIISYYGKPDLGLVIVLTASVLMVTLFVASSMLGRRLKREACLVQEGEAAAASGLTKTYSAHASET
ncbi:hypothetical protein AB4Y86_17170, partial [Arthrobacter sp. 2YAF22_2]|uniref:hypothetical protein n=1 Tax=Arthrobacter sp. 2YAF22_2 TaxID=3233029 RepID=UPI003F933B96